MNRSVVNKLIMGAAVVATAALYGCGADTSRRNAMLMFSSVSPSGWTEAQSLEFTPDSLLTAELAGRVVHPAVILRYSRLSTTAALPVEIVQESFTMRERRDTVVMRLFDKSKEEPLGQGRYGVYELSDTLAPVSVSDGWRLTLTPLADVKGIHAVGVQILP